MGGWEPLINHDWCISSGNQEAYGGCSDPILKVGQPYEANNCKPLLPRSLAAWLATWSGQPPKSVWGHGCYFPVGFTFRPSVGLDGRQIALSFAKVHSDSVPISSPFRCGFFLCRLAPNWAPCITMLGVRGCVLCVFVFLFLRERTSGKPRGKAMPSL